MLFHAGPSAHAFLPGKTDLSPGNFLRRQQLFFFFFRPRSSSFVSSFHFHVLREGTRIFISPTVGELFRIGGETVSSSSSSKFYEILKFFPPRPLFQTFSREIFQIFFFQNARYLIRFFRNLWFRSILRSFIKFQFTVLIFI